MTAPDAPAVPELWWSPSWGVLTKAVTGSGTPFYHHHRAGEALFDPPADAVRLTADEMAADILDANERMGEALVAIGMALGMPAPRTGATWGAPEILARIAGSAALAGTTTPTDEPLRTTAVAPLEHLLHAVLLESAGESAAVVAEKLTHAVLNAEWRPVSARPSAPSANWSSAWAELTGYVGQAVEDGTQIDAAGLDVYLAELKRRALSPVRDWMFALLASTPTKET